MKKQTSVTALVILSFLMFIMIIFQSLMVIFTPYIFIRTISIFPLVFCSMAIGAFIREIFILKAKKSSNEKEYR